jgi:hypothetical protein
MYTRILVATSLAALFAAVPTQAHAGTACQSTWTKATSKISRFYLPVGRVVCSYLNTQSQADAAECINNLEEYAETLADIEQTWNVGESGGWKIGPRGLPLNRPQSGSVSTERQFVGTPVLNSSYTIELNRTGGKAKKNLTATICFVDAEGNDLQQDTVVLKRNGRTSYTKTFTGVEGTIPLIHLNNQRWGTNAHKYTLESSASGEASAVQQARQTLRKERRKKKIKPGARPKKGR